MSDAAAQSARNILEVMKAASTGVHTRVPVNLAEFKHLDLAAYDAYQEEMEAHGFRHMADYEILEVTNSPGALLARTFIRTMLSRDGKVQAAYYQTRPRIWRRVKNLLGGLLNLRFISAPADFVEAMKTRHCADLETEFENGHFIVTSNAQGAGRLASPPEIDNLFFPYGTSVDELMDEHYRRLVAAMRKSSMPPLAIASVDEMHQSGNRARAIKNAFRQSRQLISRDELRKMSGGNTAYADAVYAEIVKQRKAGDGAVAGAASAASGAAPAAAASRPVPAATSAHHDYEEDEEEELEEAEQGGGRGGCLFFPLLILGLVLMMVLPSGVVGFLVRHGFRFLLPREARAQLDAARKAEKEMEGRAVPQRVARAQAARTESAAGASQIKRPPGSRPAPTPEGSLAFAYDPERGELVAAVELAAWAGYSCAHSSGEFPGGRVLLRLRGLDDAELDEPDLVHHAAVRWLLAHDQGLHDTILAALARYAPTLKAHLEDYGDDESLRLLKSPQGWKRLIDLSYVDVFPYTRDGMPYLAFEFESNWDPEHGFKLLVNGPRVVAIDDDGYGSEDVLADGGVAA
jgi:hypothetical protein